MQYTIQKLLCIAYVLGLNNRGLPSVRTRKKKYKSFFICTAEINDARQSRFVFDDYYDEGGGTSFKQRPLKRRGRPPYNFWPLITRQETILHPFPFIDIWTVMHTYIQDVSEEVRRPPLAICWQGWRKPRFWQNTQKALGQQRHAALLLAYPDFQTLGHPWLVGFFQKGTLQEKLLQKIKNSVDCIWATNALNHGTTMTKKKGFSNQSGSFDHYCLSYKLLGKSHFHKFSPYMCHYNPLLIIDCSSGPPQGLKIWGGAHSTGWG